MTSSPYVGLRPYTDLESSLFFGRERERRVVASNLVASRLTLLYGPSGVGKSSLLHAAVVPHLKAMALEQAADNESPAVVTLFNRWRDDPVAGLLEQVAGADAKMPLASALRAWTEMHRTNLLVILDQFEEYFSYHGGPRGEDRFAREFPEAVNDPTLRVNFLVSFREDALAQLDRFKGRIPRLFSNYLRVGYLDADGARQAILGPVDEYNRRAGPEHQVQVEPALVDAVLDQVVAGKVVIGQAGVGAGGAQVDAEPGTPTAIETSHLQIVMAQLWREDIGSTAGAHVLRAATLQRLGGAVEIVRGHLDRELDSLSAHQQDVAAAAFEYLVTPSGTKIAHSPTDLAGMAKVGEADLLEVIGLLSAGTSRILRPVEPAPGRTEERYEIFHDVLAPAVLDWRARYVQQRERADAETELRRQRQEAEERARAARRRARNVSIFSLVTALLVIALVLAYSARQQSKRSRSRQQAAEAVAFLSVDPTRSLRGALAAVHTANTPEAETALRQALAGSRIRSVLAGHRDWVNTAAFDPLGQRLVTASNDGTARVWDVTTGRQLVVLKGHQYWVATAVFDPSGQTVLTASADGTARLWDATGGQNLRVLAPSPPSAQVTAAFDHSGQMIVTAGSDGVARLWDTASGRQMHELRGHTSILTGASFDPAGARVVTSSADGTVRVWDVTTGRELASLSKHGANRVDRAVFSPDGTLVATGARDGNAYLWRWQTGDALLLSGHTNRVSSVQFDRSGDRLVTGGDKTARVWETKTGRLVAVLRGHSDFVTDAVFNSAGQRVATAGQDGSARVWDVATATTLTELRGHREIVWDVAFSPGDDRAIATAGSDGTARIWQLPDNLTMAHQGWVADAEYSPDGRNVITSGNDNTARIWDAATGTQEVVLKDHQGMVQAAFSPDGRMVVTDDDNQTRIWDIRAPGRPLATTTLRRGLARFTSSGNSVIANDENGVVYRWDWRTTADPQRLLGYRGVITITDLEISPDGRSLVTAGSDRVARIWDIATGRAGVTLHGHDGALYSARFSTDGAHVVTSSADGTAKIWSAATGTLVRSLVADRSLRSAAFDPTGSRVVAGEVDGTIRIWDARTGQTLSVLPAHSTVVNSAVFSPDGGLILSASDDWTATIGACPTCASLPAIEAQATQRLRKTEEPRERTVNEWALVPGDCYSALGSYATLTDCGNPHRSEVFATLEHPAAGGTFDEQQVIGYAQDQCQGRPFSDYVGRGSSKSKYQVTVWRPTQQTWDNGDRHIVCALRSSSNLTGSARGSGH